MHTINSAKVEVDCGVRAETTRLKRHSQSESAPSRGSVRPVPTDEKEDERWLRVKQNT